MATTLTPVAASQRMKLTRTDAARHDATRAADIIKAKEALVIIRVGKGRKEQTQEAIAPRLARLLNGTPGMATARALIELARTDDDLRRAGEAQGFDWESWGELVDAAGLEGKHV
jgi:hypothetical protein